MRKPILYSGTKNASSWAMRAWLALMASGFNFEEKVIDIRRPQRFENLRQIARISAPGCVPVLDTGRTIISDSIAIMEFANDISAGDLLPRDPERRARARSLVAWQHTGLSGICARISFESAFYPVKRELTPSEIREAGRFFSVAEVELSKSRGPYLFGDIGLPDFVFGPTVVRLIRHSPPLEQWPLTASWCERMLEHPLVKAWLEEADALCHVWIDDYLLPDEPFMPFPIEGNALAID